MSEWHPPTEAELTEGARRRAEENPRWLDAVHEHPETSAEHVEAAKSLPPDKHGLIPDDVAESEQMQELQRFGLLELRKAKCVPDGYEYRKMIVRVVGGTTMSAPL